MAANLNGVYPTSDAAFLEGFGLRSGAHESPAFFNNLEHVGAFTDEPTETWTSGWTLPMPAYDK